MDVLIALQQSSRASGGHTEGIGFQQHIDDLREIDRLYHEADRLEDEADFFDDLAIWTALGHEEQDSAELELLREQATDFRRKAADLVSLIQFLLQ